MFEVNERGFAQIRESLAARHKAFLGNPADIPDETVFAYADEVENHESGSFEIRAIHSISGSPETFYISDEGVDVQ